MEAAQVQLFGGDTDLLEKKLRLDFAPSKNRDLPKAGPSTAQDANTHFSAQDD
jgi:hypothetical protein